MHRKIIGYVYMLLNMTHENLIAENFAKKRKLKLSVVLMEKNVVKLAIFLVGERVLLPSRFYHRNRSYLLSVKAFEGLSRGRKSSR